MAGSQGAQGILSPRRPRPSKQIVYQEPDDDDDDDNEEDLPDANQVNLSQRTSQQGPGRKHKGTAPTPPDTQKGKGKQASTTSSSQQPKARKQARVAVANPTNLRKPVPGKRKADPEVSAEDTNESSGDDDPPNKRAKKQSTSSSKSSRAPKISKSSFLADPKTLKPSTKANAKDLWKIFTDLKMCFRNYMAVRPFWSQEDWKTPFEWVNGGKGLKSLGWSEQTHKGLHAYLERNLRNYRRTQLSEVNKKARKMVRQVAQREENFFGMRAWIQQDDELEDSDGESMPNLPSYALVLPVLKDLSKVKLVLGPLATAIHPSVFVDERPNKKGQAVTLGLLAADFVRYACYQLKVRIQLSKNGNRIVYKGKKKYPDSKAEVLAGILEAKTLERHPKDAEGNINFYDRPVKPTTKTRVQGFRDHDTVSAEDWDIVDGQMVPKIQQDGQAPAENGRQQDQQDHQDQQELAGMMRAMRNGGEQDEGEEYEQDFQQQEDGFGYEYEEDNKENHRKEKGEAQEEDEDESSDEDEDSDKSD